MGFIPVPTGVELCLVFETYSKEQRVCLNFRDTNPINSTSLADLAQTGIDAFVTHMRGVLSDTTKLKQVEATDLTSAIGPTAVATPAVPTSGTITSNVNSGSDCVVITYKTINRGRSFTGRSYVPGLPEDRTGPGIINASHVAAVLSAWQDMLFNIESTEDVEHSVLSRISGGQPRPAGVMTAVISYVGNAYIGVQKRRRVGI